MIFNKYLTEKNKLFEIVFLIVFANIATSIIADYLNSLIGKRLLMLGISLSIIVLLVVYFYLKIPRILKRKIDGFFILDNKKGKLKYVDNYEFSHKLAIILFFAFTENKNLEKYWKSKRKDPNVFRGTINVNKAILLVEATEYYLLSSLSTHLTDYFHLNNINPKKLKILQRNDIPSILLKNNFIELFSKPLELRFNLDGKNKKESLTIINGKGEKVSMYSKNGYFEKFDFVIPKSCKLFKEPDGSIVFDSDIFHLKIKIEFKGYGTMISKSFLQYYRDVKDTLRDISCKKISINFDIKFKLTSLLTVDGWKYYKWIDTFINKIEKDFSQERYFESIKWDEAYPVVKILSKKKTSSPSAIEVKTY